MSKKSREAIKGNLARAIAPPTPTRKRASHLDGLLEEYAPPDKNIFVPPTSEEAKIALEAAPSQYEAPSRNEVQPLRRGGAASDEAPPYYEGASILPSSAPHFRFAYEVLDQTLAKLDPYPRTVLIRLYRLAAGWHSDSCHVSLGKLSNHCKIGLTKMRACLRQLEADGYIKRLSIDLSNKKQEERGITFKVNLPRIAPSRREAPPQREGASPHEAPSRYEPNKEKAFKRNTLTQDETPAASVSAGSKYSLKQCVAYAEYRKTLDPNIRSPGAVARKIYETGREDNLISEWLAEKDKPVLDISQCPDCGGAGMYYPEGFGKGGVRRCDHKTLKSSASR